MMDLNNAHQKKKKWYQINRMPGKRTGGTAMTVINAWPTTPIAHEAATSS
jgi:hypothetical protein